MHVQRSLLSMVDMCSNWDESLRTMLVPTLLLLLPSPDHH
jgi:hypothetical protein